jgi:O-antigen ligase
LFWALGFLALVGALMGLYEYAVTPKQLMFQARVHKMDAVTAYFVNRNTAATFLGIGAVIWSALLSDKLRGLGLAGVKRTLLETDRDSRHEAQRLIALTLGLLAVIVALFLTKSRAGIAATLVGVVIVLAGTLSVNSGDKSRVSRLATVALSVGLVAALTAAYGDQFLARALGTDASSDLRWCFASDMIDAITERPLTGFGYGSLEYVYPAYRNPACMSLDMVLDRGHNGYLEWAMGLGLPSLAVPLAGIAYLVVVLTRGVTTRRSFRFIPAASLGALAVVVIHTAFDFSMQIPGVAAYTAAVLASGVVVSSPSAGMRRHRNRQQSILTPGKMTSA